MSKMIEFGIPTMHQERRYRSRLEARWASFFDMLGWNYEYEPFDLNGWIPDFIIFGKKENVLVEVKPYTTKCEFYGEVAKILKAIKHTAYDSCDVLLLGCTIFEAEYFKDYPVIGWLYENYGSENENYGSDEYDYTARIGEAGLNHYSKFGLFHTHLSYRDRITGLYDGDHCLSSPDMDKVRIMWNHAGNATQWKARR